MADINIEKKKDGLPWWLWALIALLVVGALIWFLTSRSDGDDRVDQTAAVEQSNYADPSYVDNTVADGAAGQPTAAMADANSGTITDISTITSSEDASLVGRDVRLSSVPVGNVVGDASFWINGADGKKVYVVLNEVATPNTPTEGRFDVNTGSRVDIVGTIQAASDGAPGGAAAGSTTDALPQGVTHFIYAQSAKVVS